MKLSLSPHHSLSTLIVANIPQGISSLLLDFVHVQQNLVDTILFCMISRRQCSPSKKRKKTQYSDASILPVNTDPGKHNLSVPTFSKSLNCDHMICFVVTSLHVNKNRPGAGTIESNRRLPHSACPPVSHENAGSHSVSFSDMSKSPHGLSHVTFTAIATSAIAISINYPFHRACGVVPLEA